MQAKDGDAALNGKIVYSILETNKKSNSSELDLFKIDRTNGNMNVNFEHQNLDKKLGTYKITVKVNIFCLVKIKNYYYYINYLTNWFVFKCFNTLYIFNYCCYLNKIDLDIYLIKKCFVL